MRILFAGTPDFAVPSLTLLAESAEISGVLTAVDAPRGRGRTKTPSPVAFCAEQLGLPVLKPDSLGASARSEIEALRPDLLVVVAYGRIFGPRFLELFPSGGLNVHPSLLPKYRGPAPIPAVILAGEVESGVSVQRLAPAMDSGDIVARESVPLDGTETTRSLTARFADLGARLLVEAVASLRSGTLVDERQEEAEATYCRLLAKRDGEIDWYSPAERIERMIRAYDPWPTAYTSYRRLQLSVLTASVRRGDDHGVAPGTVVGVDKQAGILVQTGSGSLVVESIHLQSKKPLHFRDFLNGTPDFVGSTLGGAS